MAEPPSGEPPVDPPDAPSWWEPFVAGDAPDDGSGPERGPTGGDGSTVTDPVGSDPPGTDLSGAEIFEAGAPRRRP